ncbi:MAG: hypothetical protein ACJ789_04965 [Thermomicrobiales bacterium]
MVVLVGLLTALPLLPISSSQIASGQTGWTWYKTDTHIHSVFSGDALDDLGIMSQTAKNHGYNALFLTDHNLAGDFPISKFVANHIAFDDAYNYWTPATGGSLSSTTNALDTTTVNTGTQSLHLKSSSSTFGETFIWEKRGPSFTSSKIVLKFSVYPKRIDPGSGVGVSIALGGDPSAPGSFVDGYTTQDGIIHPGRSAVFVWQLGSTRTASSNPERRVITHALGSYTLNAWNTYTIDVTAALNELPASERPLIYNAVTSEKLMVAANGGTADALFDTYTLDGDTAAADSFVYRNSIIHQFDNDSFKIFPSVERGISEHAQRFNYGITDPSQFSSVINGVDSILSTQQSGYPAMLNHPGLDGGVTTQQAISNKGYGADVIEVRTALMIQAWDGILNQGVQILGSWSSDSHHASFTPATFIFAPSLDFDSLMRSFYEGRTYNARNSFGGRIIFNLDNSVDPYPARYPVFVPANQASAPVSLAVTGGLRVGDQVRWFSNGGQIATDVASGSTYSATKSIPLTGNWTYVRAEVWSGTTFQGTTQPIFFRDVATMPAGIRFNVDGVTTRSGQQYTRLSTQGVTSSTWDATAQGLTLDLTDPTGALVRMTMATPNAPAAVKLDGVAVPQASSRSAFDSASGSIWFFDTSSESLLLKVLHASNLARLRVELSAGIDTQPPSAPTKLIATVANNRHVDLNWNAATDANGVTAYDIYRSGTLLASLGKVTTYADTSVSTNGSYTYEYIVRARDAAGNVSAASNTALAFSDGFETGNFAQWSGTSSLVIESTNVASGVKAAQGTSPATVGGATGPAFAEKQLATGQNELYYRVRFKLLSPAWTNTVYLLRVRTAANASLLGLYVSSSGAKLGYQLTSGGTTSNATSATAVSLGAWHEAQVRVRVDGAGATGQVDVWYDGTPVPGLGTAVSLGTTPIGKLVLGETATSRTFNMAFDDIAASSGQLPYLGPVGSPTPTATNTPASTSTRTPTNTITPTATATLASGNTPTFTPTKPPTATKTATPTNTATSTLTPAPALLADGFESGDLSKWTSVSGLTVQQTEVANGAWAARGTSTGAAGTSAYRQLSSAQNDVYYQLRFKIISQGSTASLYLLRFRTGTGSSQIGLYVNGNGKLSYRNDISTAVSTSATTVTPGEWHEIQVHGIVNGVNGLIEVWLDGTIITDLSRTENLGTVGIGRIQVGDNATGKTYDVAFDDVLVDTRFIGATSAATISQSAAMSQSATNVSPTISATTPQATATPTQLPVASLPFADDFESGTLAKWTSVKDLGIQRGGHESGYAAHAASDGRAGSTAMIALAKPQSDLYARSVFEIANHGNKTVTLLTLRGESGRVVSLFVAGTGKLSISNGIDGSIARSAEVIQAREWHEVQVHASIASGTLEVWLDGQRVDALSGTAALGSKPISEVLLGDPAKNRVYEVLFDDVAVDVNSIKPEVLATPTSTPTPTATATLKASAISAPTIAPTATQTPSDTPNLPPTETPTPELPTVTQVPDSDGDGVLDPQDQCPGAPDTGVDSDGDGIDDGCDPTPFGDPTATAVPTEGTT